MLTTELLYCQALPFKLGLDHEIFVWNSKNTNRVWRTGTPWVLFGTWSAGLIKKWMKPKAKKSAGAAVERFHEAVGLRGRWWWWLKTVCYPQRRCAAPAYRLQLFEKAKLETVGHSTEVNYTRYFRKFVDHIQHWWLKSGKACIPLSRNLIRCANALRSYEDAARSMISRIIV